VSSVGFTAIRRDRSEGLSDVSSKCESNIAQRDIQGWFNSDGLRTSFDDRAGSCWESDDDGGSRGEGLVVIDGRKEW